MTRSGGSKAEEMRRADAEEVEVQVDEAGTTMVSKTVTVVIRASWKRKTLKRGEI